MTVEELIKIGTLLGLDYNGKTNYKDILSSGRVVFDGCNGQRFLIDSNLPDEEIYKDLGSAVRLRGKREKALEIHRVLSINSD